MARNTWIGLALLMTAAAATAQQRQSRIDVQHYQIDAEINPRTQSLTAKVQVRFVPLEDYTSSAEFELNNALNVSKVEDEAGQQLSATRSQQNFTVTLSFPQSLAKGKPTSVIFHYDGRLTGNEESPVFGIKFAAIHPDYAYLLYPSRWFPVANYSTGRHTADLRITVPSGLQSDRARPR